LLRTFSENRFKKGGILPDFRVVTDSLLKTIINEYDFLTVPLDEKQVD
jgi:hypothetical protein